MEIVNVFFKDLEKPLPGGNQVAGETLEHVCWASRGLYWKTRKNLKKLFQEGIKKLEKRWIKCV